jgi:hypothetical protein
LVPTVSLRRWRVGPSGSLVLDELVLEVVSDAVPELFAGGAPVVVAGLPVLALLVSELSVRRCRVG